MDNSPFLDNIVFLLQHLAELRNITTTQAITVAVFVVNTTWPVYVATNPHNWTVVAVTFIGTLAGCLVHLLQSPPRANPRATANLALAAPSVGPVKVPDKGK